MILAGAALLAHGDDAGAAGRPRDPRGVLEAVAQGVRTADLGGHLGTTEFTDEVIRADADEARGLVHALAAARAGRRRADLAAPTQRDAPSDRLDRA